jgi:Mrp family chromosome partitioning ATPase
MRGRSRPPILARIAGPPRDDGAWGLRKSDFTELEKALPRLEGQRAVMVGGEGDAAMVAAISLAAASAAAGRRTVLVECDLASPRLAAQLGVVPAPGLHEYLRWEAEPRDVLRPVVLAGSAASTLADPLVCVCAGRPASKTETLLGLQSFAHMIGKLRKAYELVVLCGPPFGDPASCLAAARQADAVLAAVPEAAARDRALRKALARLQVPALGTVAVG